MENKQTTFENGPEMKRTARMMAKLRKQREAREAAQAASQDPWQRFCDSMDRVRAAQAELRKGLR